MVTYVLDSSAVLRYLDDEPGANRVAEVIKSHLAGSCEAAISALHWGEVAGITCKKRGSQAMEAVLEGLRAFGIRVVDVDGSRAVRAALIRVKGKVPYVDAFGVELTAEAKNRVFITADFDLKAASRDVNIEFLPAK
jgi:predicted nucleic acid-binding protein